MASTFTALVENVITCPVCLKHFDQPRILKECSHTFCFQCIQQMASKNNGRFECPKQDGITIEPNAINTLLVNEALRKLVELVGERSDSCYDQVFFSAVS